MKMFSNLGGWFAGKYQLIRFLFKIFWNAGNIWSAVKAFPTSFVSDDIRAWMLEWILPSVNKWVEYAKTTVYTWDDYLSEAIRRLLIEGILWDEVTLPAIREKEILPTISVRQRLRAKIRNIFATQTDTNTVDGLESVNDIPDEPNEQQAGSLAMAAVLLSIIVNGAAGAKIIGSWLGWKTEEKCEVENGK